MVTRVLMIEDDARLAEMLARDLGRSGLGISAEIAGGLLPPPGAPREGRFARYQKAGKARLPRHRLLTEYL